MIDKDEIRKKKYSTIDATLPLNKGGVVQVLENKYWWCLDGNPKQALVYNRFSPQCNSNKQIVESNSLIPRIFADAEIVFIELCFCEWDTAEYF